MKVNREFMCCEYCKHGEVKDTYYENVTYCKKKCKKIKHTDMCNDYKPNKSMIYQIELSREEARMRSWWR